MKYLGGKAKISKHVARVVREHAPNATWVWEPFCGGLNLAKAFKAEGFNVYASDVNLALVSLLYNWKIGWRPPTKAHITREGYEAAKTLPDTDPLKAFYGVALSYCGKWFGGFVGAVHKSGRPFYDEACRALTRDVACVDRLAYASFLDVPAGCLPPTYVIYCDPPYANTTGYAQTGAFDHAAFWARCDQWVGAGFTVLVSEYAAPGHWLPVWSVDKVVSVAHTHQTGSVRETATEHIFMRGSR